MKRVTISALGALLTLLAAGSAFAQSTPPAQPSQQPSPNPAALSATEIYDRARATVEARTTPPFISLREDESFTRHGRLNAYHDLLIVRTKDGKANLTMLPDSPRDRVDSKPQATDALFPMTVFGLVKRKPGEKPSMFESASTPEPTAAPDAAPKVIGGVKVVARDYDATLVGTETLDGASVYHLAMHPRFDPEHHPIRELYVDTTTFDPRRIAIQVYASAGPIKAKPTLYVDYKPVDGNWVISKLSGYIALRFGLLPYGGDIMYHASNQAFPASEPDYLFDAKLLSAHLKSVSVASPAPRQ
jgi:hypothetical protein